MSASSATAPGLVGWAAQGAPSRAAAPGLVGWVAQGAPSLAAPAGLVGWVAATAPNLYLTVRPPATQAPADTYVPLTLVLGAGTPDQQVLTYTAPGRYALSVPPGVALSLATASPRYEPTIQQVSVAAGTPAELTIQLAFRVGLAVATKVRRHYR